MQTEQIIKTAEEKLIHTYNLTPSPLSSTIWYLLYVCINFSSAVLITRNIMMR